VPRKVSSQKSKGFYFTVHTRWVSLSISVSNAALVEMGQILITVVLILRIVGQLFGIQVA
jgi:hypothetical protein